MPKVGNKRFPYSAKGRAAAAKATGLAKATVKAAPQAAKGLARAAQAGANRVKSMATKAISAPSRATSALNGLNADTARGSLYRKQGLARPGETNVQLARRGKSLRPKVGKRAKKLMGFK